MGDADKWGRWQVIIGIIGILITIYTAFPHSTLTQASTPITTSAVSPVILTISPFTKQQGAFTFSAHGFTPGGGIEIHVKKPDNTEALFGTFGADYTGVLVFSDMLSPISDANMSGNYDIWAVDTVTDKQSNHVQETITK